MQAHALPGLRSAHIGTATPTARSKPYKRRVRVSMCYPAKRLKSPSTTTWRKMGKWHWAEAL